MTSVPPVCANTVDGIRKTFDGHGPSRFMSRFNGASARRRATTPSRDHARVDRIELLLVDAGRAARRPIVRRAPRLRQARRALSCGHACMPEHFRYRDPLEATLATELSPEILME